MEESPYGQVAGGRRTREDNPYGQPAEARGGLRRADTPPYGNQRDLLDTKIRKGSENGQEVRVESPSLGRERQTSSNRFLVATACGELLVLFFVAAMNALFRFVPGTMDGASMADYDKAEIFSPSLYTRPYYDYGISLEENQNSKSNSNKFPIMFGLPAYAFQVPWFIIPLGLIGCVELVRHLYPRRQEKVVLCAGTPFPPAVRRFLRFYYVYLLHGGVCGLFVALVKLLVVAPRPHFTTVCAATTVGATLSTQSCHGTTSDGSVTPAVREALRSFPSYHAAMAVYMGTFLVLYVHRNLRLRGQYSTVFLLAFPLAVTSAIGALHRQATFHASWEDVFWGGVVGVLFALYAVYGTLDRFRERSWRVVDAVQLPGGQGGPAPPPGEGHANAGFESVQVVSDNESEYPTPPGIPRFPRAAVKPLEQVRPPTQALNSHLLPSSSTYNAPRQRFSMPPQPYSPPYPDRPATAGSRL